MGEYHANGLGAICAKRERELWRPTPVINGFRRSHFSTLSSQAQQNEKRTSKHQIHEQRASGDEKEFKSFTL
jgi:hypothetical protein